MKKKILNVFIMALFIISMFVGCSASTSEKNNTIENADGHGFCVDQLSYKKISYNLYQSNPQTHKWELIKNYPCSSKEGRYYNLELEISEEEPQIMVMTGDYSTDGEGGFEGIAIEQYDIEVDGLNEDTVCGSCRYEIEDKAGEQIVTLYCFSNDETAELVVEDIALDKLYDKNNKNIANFLVTIVLE